MKKLFILDLDNTLVYATPKNNLDSDELFSFSEYLIVYERPGAKQFVDMCNTKGDIVVYTTAEREYATMVCQNLNIKYIELFTREDCLVINGMYQKSVPDYYFDDYDNITIIDDQPEVWILNNCDKCRIIGVPAFTGCVDDNELMKVDITG